MPGPAPEAVLIDVPEIKRDGAALDGAMLDRLASLRIVRSVGAASQCVLEFHSDEPDGNTSLKLGDVIEVTAVSRDRQESGSLFKGPIRALSLDHDRGPGRFALVVECFDPSYQLATSTMHEPFREQRYDEIIKKIASHHKLKLICDSTSEVYEYFLPVGSPLDVINEITRRSGMIWYFDTDALRVARILGLGSAATLTSGDDLVRFSARVAATEQTGEVSALGWDPVAKNMLVGGATRPKSVNTAPAAAAREQLSPTDKAAVPYVARSSDEAKIAAEALAGRMESARVTGHGEADRPLPGLWPGYTVTLKGLGEQWSGDYHVTRVEFVWNGRDSFSTEFDIGPMEPSSLVELLGGHHPAIVDRLQTGVTIGIVTDNRDEANHGRVKVKLPYFNGVESNWARVVQPGAGRERGMQEMPEIDDEVIVAFEHGEFDRPYVLGGVWGDKAKPPLPVDKFVDGGKVVARTYTTRSGHSWTIHDDEAKEPGIVLELADGKVIKVEKKNGVLVECKDQPIKLVGKNSASIAIDAQGNITIEGQKVTIKSKQGDVAIESAMNLSAKAKLNLKGEASVSAEIKGQASVKLESGGVAEVKGAMVKVN